MVNQSTGGYFSTGERYRYQVTAILPEGETKATGIKTIVISYNGSDNVVRIGWNAVARATGYNIYGRNYPSGPSGLSATVNAADGTLAGGKTYSYYVTAVGPDGETTGSTIDVEVPAGTSTNGVRLEWYRMPSSITAYKVYGRENGGDPQLVHAEAQPAAGTDPAWFDDGRIDPDGLPPDPYPTHFIDTTTNLYYVDTGISAPDYERPRRPTRFQESCGRW